MTMMTRPILLLLLFAVPAHATEPSMAETIASATYVPKSKALTARAAVFTGSWLTGKCREKFTMRPAKCLQLLERVKGIEPSS